MATSEQPSPVVLDVTVLSNFALTDDLDLLDEIPARFVTVDVVEGELQRGIDDGVARDRANDLAVPLTGSVGLLIRLVRDGVLVEEDVNEIHGWWVVEGRFRSHVETISDVF